MIQENIETIREFRENVDTGVLVGSVETLLDHLQLTNLLTIDPDDLSEVFTPEEIVRL